MGATASTAKPNGTDAGVVAIPVELELENINAGDGTRSRDQGSMADMSVTSADLKPEHYKRGAAQDEFGLSLVFEDKIDLDAAMLLQAHVRGYIVQRWSTSLYSPNACLLCNNNSQRKTGRIPRFRMRPNEDGNATVIQQRRRSSIVPYTSALRMSRDHTRRGSAVDSEASPRVRPRMSLISPDNDESAIPPPTPPRPRAAHGTESPAPLPVIPPRTVSVDAGSPTPMHRVPSNSILKRTGSVENSMASLGDVSRMPRSSESRGPSRPGSVVRIFSEGDRTKSVSFGGATVAEEGAGGSRASVSEKVRISELRRMMNRQGSNMSGFSDL